LKYLKESTFAIPPTFEEQRHIASFFRSLDEQIKIQTQQVEKLKQVKKACLNQFIA
jgi:type I restriction enzyme S subunit